MVRTYSRQTQLTLTLLSQLIKSAPLEQQMSAQQVADRAGNEASQGMLITDNDRSSRLATCIRSAHAYLLSETEAEAIVEQLLEVIHQQWQSVCDVAQLSELDRQLLWRRQFLNPSIFEMN